MPQPRRQPAAPPPSGTGYDAAAAAAAGVLAAPAATASATPAVAAGASALLSATVIQKTTAVLLKAMAEFADASFLDGTEFAIAALSSEFPQAEADDIRRVLSQEERFEKEFRRKMKARLSIDLPKALAITDPAARAEAIRAILEREKRYTQQREEAMLVRAMGKLEALLLKGLSPEGAYWKLFPHVKEHTLDCLAMGEKFWPWSVLKRIQPPLHLGCPCYLLGLDEAVEMGLMTKAQVPDPKDADRRYSKLKATIGELEDRDTTSKRRSRRSGPMLPASSSWLRRAGELHFAGRRVWSRAASSVPPEAAAPARA